MNEPGGESYESPESPRAGAQLRPDRAVKSRLSQGSSGRAANLALRHKMGRLPNKAGVQLPRDDSYHPPLTQRQSSLESVCPQRQPEIFDVNHAFKAGIPFLGSRVHVGMTQVRGHMVVVAAQPRDVLLQSRPPTNASNANTDLMHILSP